MMAKLQNELMYTWVDNIDFGERRRQKYENMDELKESMSSPTGLIEPIAIMRKAPKEVKHEDMEKPNFLLLAGGRRLKAAQELGWNSIACHIYPFMEDERDRRIIELMENIQRDPLTFAEEAILTAEIHDLYISIKGKAVSSRDPKGGHTKEATAELLKQSVSKVKQSLELAEAFKTQPELADMKNKVDALAAIIKQKEAIVVSELARRARLKVSQTDKYRAQLFDNYLIGDTVEVMNKLPAESFSIAEIDPPYGIELRKVVELTESQKKLLWAGGMTKDEEAAFYIHICNMLKATYRILKPNAWCLLWFAIDPWIEPFYHAAMDAGFIGNRVPALWVKNTGNTRTPNIHLKNWFECFMYFRKGNAMLARPGASNVFAYGQLSNKNHPNEKPVEMYEDILRTFTQPGTNLISPYAGSGNVMLAAANCGMDAVGIDLDSDHKDKFSIRLFNAQPGNYKSY